MKEIKEIIKAFEENKKTGNKLALASVVLLNGSSYRRPGARMIVNSDGKLTGAISGGCLEGDALRKALMVINQQKSKLVTYDTTDEDDATIGVQLGCEGIIQVLFEPILFNSTNHPIELLKKSQSKRQNSVLITLFNSNEKGERQIGTCALIEEDNTLTGSLPIKEIEEEMQKDINLAFTNKSSLFMDYHYGENSITAFIEYIPRPISLIVFGAGNDAIPLVHMADTLGWEVSVIDGRNTHAKQNRFEAACQVIVSKPEKSLEHITLDDRTVFVLMTHNYNYDLAVLQLLLTKKVTYIGILGPKKKLEKMLQDLEEKGFALNEDLLNLIYSPTGLEIGAETSEEIALSILAEIKAVLSGHKGGFLRNKLDVIHSRIDTQTKYKKL